VTLGLLNLPPGSLRSLMSRPSRASGRSVSIGELSPLTDTGFNFGASARRFAKGRRAGRRTPLCASTRHACTRARREESAVSSASSRASEFLPPRDPLPVVVLLAVSRRRRRGRLVTLLSISSRRHSRHSGRDNYVSGRAGSAQRVGGRRVGRERVVSK